MLTSAAAAAAATAVLLAAATAAVTTATSAATPQRLLERLYYISTCTATPCLLSASAQPLRRRVSSAVKWFA
eukprot:16962-Heterococcus_DN1.PRE.1